MATSWPRPRVPAIQRQHYICESSDEITRVSGRPGGVLGLGARDAERLKAAPLELVDPASQGLRFWRVDHSIPGSGAFGIETPIGWVIYSGDLRTHGHSSWRTKKFVEEAAALKPALFIVEGTRVGDKVSPTEPNVYDAIDQIVAAEPGLVIADFSARNIERLRTFRDIARARNRRLIVTTKDAYLLQQLHRVDPQIPCPTEEIGVLKEFQGSVQLWERGVHTDCSAEPGRCQADPARPRRLYRVHLLLGHRQPGGLRARRGDLHLLLVGGVR